MDLDLKGRRVLVTGASQGIGEGLARAFAAEGCELYLVARSAEKLDGLAAQLRAASAAPVHTLACDLTTAGAVDRVLAFAGVADVLVNNAGNILGGTLWQVDEARWREGWELKVYGYINLTRAFYPAMKARGGGVILNNIGNGGENYDFDYIAGTTGNAALMAFTRALGGRSLQDGVRVAGVNPGPVATPRIEKVLRARADDGPDADAAVRAMTASWPLGRAATVAEVADLFVYLASDRSRYTSGAIFTVDGGISSRRSIT
ncbi:short-chain dehydrogenase/reductase [Achromobacter xylosoxidans]|uniref:short-chain dehydrogenase/reductase n=1 Tax=Alcaligenes xylosoxydans xylosoxydans TaxID=85698 RepID=UPI000666F408|nr:short-chain dehydrogenase/reductase [Achromobacter xylosoxidans]